MRFAAIVAALGLAIAVIREDAIPQMAQAQATLMIPRERYLSTESVVGTLAIVNPTSQRLSYSPLGVSFVLRDATGTTERRYVTMVTMLPRITWIDPGATQRIDLALPGCEVLSDPCVVNVAVKVVLRSADADVTLVTAERSYAFFPDSSATYREGDVHGNRPLILARAETDGALAEKTMRLRFHFSAPPTPYQQQPVEGDAVDAIFKKLGLQGGSGFTTTADGFDIVRFLPEDAPDATVDAALADVLHAFGDRVTIEPRSYIPSAFDVFPVASRATDAARAVARRVAAFLGAEPIEVNPVASDAAVAIERSGQLAPFVPLGDFISFEFASAPSPVVATSRGQVVTFHVLSTGAFVGASTITSPPCCTRDVRAAGYIGPDESGVLALPLQLTIAADRPELYTIAETTTQKADALGLQPDAVALAHAAERARALEADLGVTSGPLTLAATYPFAIRSENRTIVPAGIAIAPSGNADALWRSLVPPPTPMPGLPQGPFTPVALLPTPTPATPSSVAPSTPRPQPAFAIPIVLPDAATQLSAHADVPARRTPEDVDCDALASRAERSSLREALSRAIAASRATAKILRHLVFVAAYPATVEGDEVCTPSAFRAKPFVVHVPIDVVFRTR